ncbi:MAG: YncE family protein [Bdellovibrionota bacterium]
MKNRSILSGYLLSSLYFGVSVFGPSANAKETRKLLVTLMGEDNIAIINPADGAVKTKIPVGGEPHDVICSSDGKWAYVSNPKTDDFSVIDIEKASVHKTIPFTKGYLPWHVEISQDDSKVFVALQHASRIAVINTANFKVSYIHTPEKFPGPWAISTPKGGTKVYVSLNGSIPGGTANSGTRVGVFDSARTNPKMKTIRVGKGPHGMIASPDGTSVYVANQYSHEIWKIDVATDKAKLLAKIAGEAAPAPGFPTDVAVSPDGKFLLTGNHDIDSVTLINAESGAIVATVKTGPKSLPWGGTFDSDSARAFIANNGTDDMHIVDLGSKTISKTVSIGKGPDGMAWCR